MADMSTVRPPNRRVRTLFISDLHLGTKGCQAELFLYFMRVHDADTIYLVGAEFWAKPDPTRSHLGKSLWLREIHGRDEGRTPPTDLTIERNAGEIVRQLIADGLVNAVHDVSDGGLAVALAEMALAGGLGAEVSGNGE